MENKNNQTPMPLLYLQPKRRNGNGFNIIVLLTMVLFSATGLYLKTIKPLEIVYNEKQATVVKTQFVMAEKKKPPKPKPKVEPPKPVEDKQVYDLTKSPILNQKTDFTPPEQTPVQQNQPAPRPVYGLRRVYSTGLGSGGSAADAVIGKRGNTLDKDIDTATVTPRDLKAPLASVSTVTKAPELKHPVKPVYTKEMIEAKVEGVIKAELLIDGDGKVKEVRILNDLGYGTKEQAIQAFLQWEFSPAYKDGKPVSVWYSYSIRFVLLQE